LTDIHAPTPEGATVGAGRGTGPGDALEEDARLWALETLHLWHAAAAPELDRVARLVRDVFQVPTVLISLVGRDRQRFVSRVGFDIESTGRDVSVCAVAIRQCDVLEVEDLSVDPRFASNPLVTGEPGLRFYAGAPLLTTSGHAVGTLCLIDYVPRRLAPQQREHLTAFARLVMDQVALRKMVGRRDGVSGLLNRQQFYADLEAMAAERFPGTRMLILVDIMDQPLLYQLAQALGMAPVESIIHQVGLRLHALLSARAEVYHVAVARFAVVVQDGDASSLAALLQSVEHCVNAPLDASGIPLRPLCRGGVVAFDAASAADALRKAMTATHEAIATKRPWCFYDAEGDAALQRQYRLAADIGAGIEGGQFHLVYQPRVRLADRAIIGAEALLRWRHPELGDVSPGEFVPIASRTTYMRALTDWVIDETCRQLAQWRAQGIAIPLSVNVSASDFEDGALMDRLRFAMARHRVVPADLELEITEGQWLESAEGVVHQLERLREVGVRIAIDDFGVGYSNFSYLYTIPFDTLKIDQGLIRGFLRNERQYATVRGMIRLCNQLGIEAVAEGVESSTEHDALLGFECPAAQGYLYARPQPPGWLAGQLLGRNTDQA
jgi:EAL domain-containing protein (putative c-di-GMP-specific phosphodiesterase class I)/GGDEF domain-containing protein